MVGLPYPNPKDPELRERMAFMDANAADAATAGSCARTAASGASPGRQYYSDLCMKVPPRQCLHTSSLIAMMKLPVRVMRSVSSEISAGMFGSVAAARALCVPRKHLASTHSLCPKIQIQQALI